MIEALAEETSRDADIKEKELELRRLELGERRLEREENKREREGDRKERIRLAEIEQEKTMAIMNTLLASFVNKSGKED